MRDYIWEVRSDVEPRRSILFVREGDKCGWVYDVPEYASFEEARFAAESISLVDDFSELKKSFNLCGSDNISVNVCARELLYQYIRKF